MAQVTDPRKPRVVLLELNSGPDLTLLPDDQRRRLIEDVFRAAVDVRDHSAAQATHAFSLLSSRSPRHADSVRAMERVVNNAGRFMRALHERGNVDVRGVHEKPAGSLVEIGATESGAAELVERESF